MPGSKNVRKDMQWLRDQGWDHAIEKHLRYGGKVIGICGGFQMLGSEIHDIEGIEDVAGSSLGLGFLNVSTRLESHKQLSLVKGTLNINSQNNAQVQGYEIHCGVTEGAGLTIPAVNLSDGSSDGAISDDNQVLGTYLHGVFEHPDGCTALLKWAGLESPQIVDQGQIREAQLERLAKEVEKNLDCNQLFPAYLDQSYSPEALKNGKN